MNIDKIESLTLDQSKEIGSEIMVIKEHDCIFADLGDPFGFSVLVFKNGKHIHYANDYELHHKHMARECGKDKLKQYYIEEMKNKLYTDSELLEECRTYGEYDKKSYFLRNYWIMRYPYVSSFYIGEEQRKVKEKAKKQFPYFNPISFCYVADKKIIEIQTKYFKHLQKCYKKLQSNNDTFREMIHRELQNHEACITCDCTEALQALGMTYDSLTKEQKRIVNEELNKEIARYDLA